MTIGAAHEGVRADGPGSAGDVRHGAARFGDEKAAGPGMDGRDPEDDVRGDAAGGQVRRGQRGPERAKVPSIRLDGRGGELGGLLAPTALRLAVFDDDGPTLVAGSQRVPATVVQAPRAPAPLRDIDLARRWIADDGDG